MAFVVGECSLGIILQPRFHSVLATPKTCTFSLYKQKLEIPSIRNTPLRENRAWIHCNHNNAKHNGNSHVHNNKKGNRHDIHSLFIHPKSRQYAKDWLLGWSVPWHRGLLGDPILGTTSPSTKATWHREWIAISAIGPQEFITAMPRRYHRPEKKWIITHCKPTRNAQLMFLSEWPCFAMVRATTVPKNLEHPCPPSLPTFLLLLLLPPPIRQRPPMPQPL